MKKENRIKFVNAQESLGAKSELHGAGLAGESLPGQTESYKIPDFFTLDEEKKLLQALTRSSTEGTFTEDQYVQLMNWAVTVKEVSNTLDLLMMGTLKPVFKNNDIHFEPAE